MRIGRKDLEEFADGVRGRKNLYCFGAGKAFTGFLQELWEYRLEDDIKSIVDNSKEKHGTMVQGGARGIPVISPEQMLGEIASGDVILITAARFPEIMEQLDSQEKLKDIECYVYAFLRIEQYDHARLKVPVPKSLAACREQRIPKVIHYCWFGGGRMPDQYRRWMESWSRHCPDYEIIEWNEKNYDVRKNQYVRQAYEAGKWAFVSDYARVDIVYEHGGVYLDTDVELTRNIDEMLRNDAFCGFQDFQYVAYGLGFGAKRGNPIVGEIREYYDHADFVSGDGTLNQTPCPVVQTEIMQKHGLVRNGEFQVVDGMAVYPSRVLCGMSPYSFRIERSLEHTYAIHHFSGSWNAEGRQRKKRIQSYAKDWIWQDGYLLPV